MSGIDRDITPDPRPSLIDRYLPNTPQVQRLLRRESRAHVFSDRETLERVTEAIIKDGERTGINNAENDYERYGLYFSEPIGYMIRIDGSQTFEVTPNIFEVTPNIRTGTKDKYSSKINYIFFAKISE